MTTHLRVTIAAAGLFAPALLPGVAVAAPDTPDSVRLQAVGERSSESARPDGLTFRRGGITRDTVGVYNRGDSAVDGLVLQMTMPNDDFGFARLYDNCWYALEGKPGSAWCEFDTDIPAKATLQLAGPVVSATDDAENRQSDMLAVRWVSRAWADAAGGIEALSNEDATAGTHAVRGTEGTLTLEAGPPRFGSITGGAEFPFPLHLAGTDEPLGAPNILPPSGPDSADLDAVQERTVAGERPKFTSREPNEPVTGSIGVRNRGAAAVDGVVVELRLADDDMVFLKKHENCWYALRGKPDSAWCQFDRAIAPGATLKLGRDVAMATEQRRGDILKDIRFRWASAAWAGGYGGIKGLAEMSATPGTRVERGTGDALTLVPASGDLKPGLTGAADYIHFSIVPYGNEPSTPPTTTAPGGGQGDGGGLAVTGTQTATLAAVGGGLLLAGLLGYATARRRRTRFIA